MPDFPTGSEEAQNGLVMLAARLREIHNRTPHPDPLVAEEVVKAVLDTMVGRLSDSETNLLKEVGELGRIIAQTKLEIADISVESIMERQIPRATDELDAISAHTAHATNSILESCEMLDLLAEALGGTHADTLRRVTTQIYEACSFQDITGQRIAKVVKTLKVIEAKVMEISASFGTTDHHGRPELSGQSAAEASNLLEGPRLPHLAMDQANVDKLLADLD